MLFGKRQENTSNTKVLLVSEDEVFLGLAKRELAPLDAQIKSSVTVVEALRLTGWMDPDRPKLQWLPTLIIADWKMPLSGYDGLEFLYIVRNDPVRQRCRFLLRGAWMNPLYDGPAFFESWPIKADAYLPTGMNTGELLTIAKRVLSQSKAA